MTLSEKTGKPVEVNELSGFPLAEFTNANDKRDVKTLYNIK
jgi:hypothetical protein